MRAPVLLAAFLVAAPFVAAGPASDARDVAANLVLDPQCPGYAQPATVACFDATGASSVRILTLGVGQPRMLVQLQNATVQYSIHWLCEDRAIGWGAENVTRVVVTLHPDRMGCWDDDLPLLTGTLEASFA